MLLDAVSMEIRAAIGASESLLHVHRLHATALVFQAEVALYLPAQTNRGYSVRYLPQFHKSYDGLLLSGRAFDFNGGTH